MKAEGSSTDLQVTNKSYLVPTLGWKGVLKYTGRVAVRLLSNGRGNSASRMLSECSGRASVSHVSNLGGLDKKSRRTEGGVECWHSLREPSRSPSLLECWGRKREISRPAWATGWVFFFFFLLNSSYFVFTYVCATYVWCSQRREEGARSLGTGTWRRCWGPEMEAPLSEQKGFLTSEPSLQPPKS